MSANNIDVTSAKLALRRLRDGLRIIASFDSHVEILNANLNAAGLTLADIGTSLNEIQKMRVTTAKSAVDDWLKLMHGRFSSVHDHDVYANYLREDLAAAGLKLGDTGMSETALAKLRVQVATACAKGWLERLEEGVKSLVRFDSFVRYLMVDLDEGGLTLRNLGTSQKRLRQLRQEAGRRSAEACLALLRRGVGCPSIHADTLRADLKAVRLKLADIETSEAEMASFIAS